MTLSASTIYTKTGDDGTTGRLFGGRLAKDSPLVEVTGDVDEAVAALGLARAALADSVEAVEAAALVLRLQRDLFVVAADLSANPRARGRLVPGISLVTAEMVDRLEREIDRLVDERPLRPVFVVPGATTASAALDLARAVVRRAERAVTRLPAADRGGSPVLPYLNRLGDLLFVLARHAAGAADEEPSHH